ncbi:aminoglycoside N(3)-acetyltransferase [Halocatena halophila]|uniref:aminoglycoside N(3)-acetyltransferase n=1 Tax=Halocatena halophila TaxID=2814576 RepID=UPI002ED241FA
MTEVPPAQRSEDPITVDRLADDLRSLGLDRKTTVLVHASLASLGWVCGGAPAVVDALQRVVTRDGTIVMATHSPGNRDPANMNHPPIPESWYERVRESMAPYRPALTPTQGMGAILECFRSYPDVRRSAHPQHSFAAWGENAQFVTEGHSLDYSLGENSPLARVYDLDGEVLFLGTTHATNTSLHLAEYRSSLALEQTSHASAIVVDGEREWREWEDVAFSDADFPACGSAFERDHPVAVTTGDVGATSATLLEQPAMVDYAVEWFETNRE